MKPTAQDVAQAEAAVAGAKLALKTQEDALAKLVTPTAQDIAEVEAAVAPASLTLKNLTDALDLAKGGPAQADVAKAQLAVDVAGTALDGARADLLLARKEWDAKTKTAQDAFDSNLNSYKEVFRKWLGIELSAKEGKLDPATLLKSWGADLTSLFDSGLRLQNLGATHLSAWGTPDDPATRWNEVTVFLWLNFFPFTLVPTCENRVVSPQTLCVKKELDDAWNAHQSAKDNLETVQTQAAKALANADTSVRRSEDGLAGARDALAKLNGGVALVEVEAKDKQVALARANLAKAQEDLAKLMGKPDQVDVDAKEKQVAVARASLAKAQDDLAKLVGKPGSGLLGDRLELVGSKFCFEDIKNTVTPARLSALESKYAKTVGDITTGATLRFFHVTPPLWAAPEVDNNPNLIAFGDWLKSSYGQAGASGVVFDLQAIESTDSSGNPCLQGGVRVICSEWANAPLDPHLNDVGAERAAKAFLYMLHVARKP